MDPRQPSQERDPIRYSDSLRYTTTDSPSGYLVESEIAMVGRLADAKTPRARRMAKVFATVVLIAMLVPMVLGAWHLLGW